MLLRSASHRRLPGGGLEIAAAPDTPGRERWQWSLRLHPHGTRLADPDVPFRRLATPLQQAPEQSLVLETAVGEAVVDPLVRLLGTRETPWFERERAQLAVLLVVRGRVCVEGRHFLDELDALVLEGDDPCAVSLEAPPGTSADVAVVTLRPVGVHPVAWIP